MQYGIPDTLYGCESACHAADASNVTETGWILRSYDRIEVPIAAVSLGATVIEKHFTLDKQMEGPDHRASLEPQELARMVAAIRNIEQSLGDGRKRRTASEEKNCAVARKSIVAKCAIAKGDYFTEENLTVKRPGTGISPMKWYEVLGMQATRDYEADELI